VAFVTMKGITYAMHGFTIGAVSAAVLLTPVLALTLNWARTPAGTADWHGGARQFIRVMPLAALGSLFGLLLVVLATGEAFEIPFQYTVWVNRSPEVLDTAFRITTGTTVGNLVVVLPGLFLTWFFLRRYGSLRGVGDHNDRVAAVERGIGIAIGLFTLLVTLLVLPLPDSLAVVPIWPLEALARTLALPLVWLAAIAAVGLLALALGRLLVGDGDVATRGIERAQSVRVGLVGGLVVLVGAVLLEPTGGVNPSVGPANLVPAVAMVGLVGALAVAGLTWLTRRRTTDADVDRILGKEGTLAMGVAAGFAVVAALHVALMGVSFSLGPLTIGYTGTFSWPMVMDAYIPLGAEPGGIMPAVVGTVWLVAGAALFAVPLGVGAAVFLTEYAEQGRFTQLVEIATNALWSTPSIVFGLFGAAFLIPRLGGDESLMSGMLVLGFMLLPLVLITSREAIKSVPDEYRDASAALGVSQWETIKSVVVPASMPGVITGVILGVGRIAGETAPLILVLGSTLNSTESIDVLGGFQFIAEPPFVYNPTLLEAAAALPTQVWAVIAAGVSGSPSMGWASALVLLMVVLSFYAVGIVARTYFRRKLDYE
jgi:phosphate transport system permease protein